MKRVLSVTQCTRSPWLALAECPLHKRSWVAGRTNSLVQCWGTAHSGSRKSLARRPRRWASASFWMASQRNLKRWQQPRKHEIVMLQFLFWISLTQNGWFYLCAVVAAQQVEAWGWTETACTPAAALPSVCLQVEQQHPCLLPESISHDSCGCWRETHDLREREEETIVLPEGSVLLL